MHQSILCIGEALIDMICTDSGQPLSAGEHFIKKAGGAPGNVAAAIAALGGKVALLARTGTDPFGQFLQQTLRSFDVDTQWLIQDPDYFTSFAFVSLMENGERDFYFNRGADGMLQPDDVNAIDLELFPMIHFGSATAFLPGPLQSSYRLLLDKALRQQKFISFDPNYRQFLYRTRLSSYLEQAWHFLQHCHFCKLSLEEAGLLTGCSQATDALNSLAKNSQAVIAITLGKEGTLLRTGTEHFHIDSIPVHAVDSTGAGDAFVGAVLYQLSQLSVQQMPDKNGWMRIITQANKAGARTCEYLGAMEAFRHLSADIFS